MIIGIHGYAGVGKDEVGSLIAKHTKTFKVKKFAGKLKQIATILTGIPTPLFESPQIKESNLPGWDMTIRELLQRLGTEAVRDGLHPNAWVMALMSDYMQGDEWVITDMRFKNEYDTIKTYGGYTIKVTRPGVNPVNSHSSEDDLADVKFDYEICNDGTLDDLENKVRDVLSDLLIDHYI